MIWGFVRLTAKPRYLLMLHLGKKKSHTFTALVIITNTCRGRQLPGDVYAGDVSLYSVIKRCLNSPYFNIWPQANSETFIMKSRCTINGIFRNRLMYSIGIWQRFINDLHYKSSEIMHTFFSKMNVKHSICRGRV